jgi:hypothetical protein
LGKRILTWYEVVWVPLFLLAFEKAVLPFGGVFKNKTNYGTSRIGRKKIRVTPVASRADAELIVCKQKKKVLWWSEIPGNGYFQRVSTLLFCEELEGV